MKKIISVLLIITSLLLVSCGSGSSTPDDEKTIGALTSEGLAYRVDENNPTTCVITGIGTCTDTNISIPPYIDGKRVVGIENGAFSASESAMSTDARPVSLSISLSDSQPDGNEEDEPVSPEEIESITIPFTVTSIGDEAFLGCTELEAISTHKMISAIGKDAFKDTAYYNNAQNWDGGALYISSYLINVSSDVSGEFTVKEGTTLIASQAFYKCDGLTVVNVAGSVTSVGNYAFYGCSALTYVNTAIEGGLVLGDKVFYGCFSYQSTIPGSGNLGENSGSNGSSSLFKTYDLIDDATFESIKNNLPENYTAIARNPGLDTELRVVRADHELYCVYREGGEIVMKLYGIIEDGGIKVYMNVGVEWYLTIAEIPDVYSIIKSLCFDDLTVKSAITNMYFYPTEKDGQIEFGFSGNNLVHMSYLTEEGDKVTVQYSGFGESEVRDFLRVPLIDNVIVDENGNIITE